MNNSRRFSRSASLLAIVIAQLSFWAAAGLTAAETDGFLCNGVTAHRGNSAESPENTLTAFRSAIALGADWIELDVYPTRDGRLVISHDKRTGRVGDVDLLVSESTYQQLQAVDVAALFRRERGQSVAEYPPQRMPLLEDALKLVMSQRKTRVSIHPKAKCVAEIVALVRKLGAQRWVGFNDGKLETVAEVKRLAPELPVCWDRGPNDAADDLAVARQHGFEAIVLHYTTATPQRIAAIKQAGFAAGAWTVNDRCTMRRLLDLGVERIYTDFPAALLAVKAERDALGKPPSAAWVESASLPAPEANQAAAADDRFVYAINSAQIAKYDRASGRRLAVSTGEAKHLNSGFLWRGRLYCAHSNFPHVPEISEIKALDLATMELATFKAFGNFGGSLTWVVRQGDSWWCNFARYGEHNGETFLVKFDDQWRELGRWTYPPELIAKLGRFSLSGGLWQADSLLATDHDHRALYRLRLPQQGRVMEFVETLASPFPGQGIAADPLTGGLLGIDRAKRRVVFAKLAPAGPSRKTVRLLTIGNSFSRNATHWLADLTAAAGHELIHHPLVVGGAPLSLHWDRAERYEKDPTDKRAKYGQLSLREELAAEKWDFVTIQQYSMTSHDPATYWPYARRLRDYVAKYAPQAELLVHETWAYRADDPRFTKPPTKPGEPTSQKAMYAALAKAYEGIAAELGLRMIPVGAAFNLADSDAEWGFRPDRVFDPAKAIYPALPNQRHSLHVGWQWKSDKAGKQQLRMDGHHANMAGEYLGACVFYEVLFDESVVNMPFVPEGLDAEYARFLRETAHRAVQKRQPWMVAK